MDLIEQTAPSRPRFAANVTRTAAFAIVAGMVVFLIVSKVRSFQGNDAALHGTWKLDREYTEAHLPRDLVASPDSRQPTALSLDPQVLKARLVNEMFKMLSQTTLRITPLTITHADGKELPYEILFRRENTWTVKTADGHIEMLKLEGDRLSLESRGDVRLTCYFSRMGN